MKKFLLSLIMLMVTATSLFAQRDREHWIAPFFDSSGTLYNKALYFSTDSVTPFEVKIYSNNVQIGAVTIALNDPKVFFLPQNSTADPDVDPIEMSNTNQAYTAINKGIYTSGPKEYFLTLRIYNGSHGEILTSKGRAGLGTTFYAAYTPGTVTSSANNFTSAILATEDNTSVTVTGFNSGVTFINQPSTTNTITFTLNKGQSYILAGTMGAAANATGFIGAKIVSTKPVTLTNGNSNGFYATGTSDGSDLILDQSVPADRLGKEFAMIRTLGALNTGYNMEGGLIVATENNTEIYLNNGGTPVATINEGQFYRILDADYVQQGTSTHYNIFVRATKNVYLYQFVSGNSNAKNNGGYNYIPPLNCFLPKKIEQIGKVNEMPTTATASSQPTSTFLLKLNIITEAGASVLVNNVAPTAAEGPYPLSGNSQWVTYALSGVQGNLTITSTKAVTAGVNGGYSSAGYGGYFAGFSSVPLISKVTGDCIPGIVLEVPDNFDTYQWYLNGVAIPGATSYSYTPTVPGNYTVNVTVGTCPGVTTPIFKVYRCLQQTNTSMVICGIKEITPTFTNPLQPVNPATVQIITPPTSGTAVVNPTTGVITYTPAANFLGTVTMVYQFCGTSPNEFIDCEKVTLTLQVVPFTVTDRTIFACQYNGKAYFDLTTANVTDTTVPFVRKYYPTLADLNAGTNEITNPTLYFSGEGSVYVNVTTSEGCKANAKITLKFFPSPIVNDATISQCFLEINETQAKFDLNTAVVTGQTVSLKRFYPTFTDASNGTNEILPNLAATYYSGDAVVYVRVYSTDGCYSIAKITLKVIPPKRSAQLVDKFICIDERTTLDAGPGYQSYTWSTGATTQSIQGVSVGQYWVLLKDNGCTVKQIVNVKKIQDPVISSVEISNNSATVIATGGTAPYEYSLNGIVWQTSNVFTNLVRGENTFYVKDSYNCAPVSTQITVPNLINAITPNGDNKNDYIDYRELSYKQNLTFTIYDRYGNKIFTGDKFNNYRWDGKHFDKKIITGTYWYHISWNEPNPQKTPVKYTGWILVKNRE